MLASFKKNPRLVLRTACLLLSLMAYSNLLHAEQQPMEAALKKTYSIPAGSLAKALYAYSAAAGILLMLDPTLVTGKTTRGLEGEYAVDEGFDVLLQGSRLQAVSDEHGRYRLQKYVTKLAECMSLNSISSEL